MSNPHIFCQLLEAATGISLSEDDIRATEVQPCYANRWPPIIPSLYGQESSALRS